MFVKTKIPSTIKQEMFIELKGRSSTKGCDMYKKSTPGTKKRTAEIYMYLVIRAPIKKIIQQNGKVLHTQTVFKFVTKSPDE